MTEHYSRTNGLEMRLEELETRRVLSGVTVITHGGQSTDAAPNVPGWVSEMANALNARLAAPAVQYDLIMNSDGTSQFSRVSAVDIGVSGNDYDIIVRVNWAALSGTGAYDGVAIGNELARALARAIPGTSHAFIDFPLHFIGHSRGVYVNNAAIKLLGQNGIWVDHNTTLDGQRDPLVVDGNFENWSNIRFADNFYQTEGIVEGFSVPGSEEFSLSAKQGFDDWWKDHSRVHAYYLGTIDVNATSDAEGFQIQSNRLNWYGTTGQPSIGFARTLIYGGVRPSAGLASAGAARTTLTPTSSGSSRWDNVEIAGNSTHQSLLEGDSFPVSVRYEDVNEDSYITVGLDYDSNPYNSNFYGTSIQLASAALDGAPFQINLDTPIAADGLRIYAKIGNGTHTRYFYAPGDVLVSPKAVSPPQIQSVSPTSLPTSTSRQTLTITGTGFTSTSTLKFNDGVQDYLSIAQYLRITSATKIEYDIAVGSNPGNWTVQVLDNGQASNSKSFAVVARPSISSIADQSIARDSSTGAIAFTVGDVETPAAQLTVSASSSNQTLLPAGGIVLGGSGSSRTIALTPAQNQTGSTTVTVTVTDTSGLSSSTTFSVNVLGTAIGPVTISPNGGTFTDAVQVTLSSSTAGGTIRYTLDGSDPTITSPTYTYSFSITSSATLKARQITDAGPSDVASATFTINYSNSAAAPVITPNGGTFSTPTYVQMYSDTFGAVVRYTTDGTDPTTTSTQYTSAFTLFASATVKARAFIAGKNPSPITTASFVVNSSLNNNLFANRISLNGASGNVMSSNVSATKESGEPNIYRSDKGSADNQGGKSIWWRWIAPYTGTVQFSTINFSHDLYDRTTQFDTMLGAYTGSAVSSLTWVAGDDDSGGGYANSLISFNAVEGQTYNIVVDGFYGSYNGGPWQAQSGDVYLHWRMTTPAPTVSTPAITPNGGTSVGAVQVTIASTTTGSIVRYTLDGSNPTAISQQYTGPFTVSSSLTVKARGFKSDYADSAMASASFVVNMPAISISTASASEGNSGTKSISFDVSLSIASPQTVSVNYSTSDGTATTAGGDYQAASGTLVFSSGETSKTISVLVNGDGLREADETFSVVLSSPVNATLSNSSVSGTINNDDAALAASGATFDYATHPSKIRVAFSGSVVASLANEDLRIVKLATGQILAPVSFTYDPTTNTAIFTLAEILDGNYTATIPAGSVSDVPGNPLQSDYSFDFFVLNADANRDRTVNFFDLTALSANYGQSGKTWADGDFNGDGMVNFFDLTALAANYSVTLPAPAAVPSESLPTTVEIAPVAASTAEVETDFAVDASADPVVVSQSAGTAAPVMVDRTSSVTAVLAAGPLSSTLAVAQGGASPKTITTASEQGSKQAIPPRTSALSVSPAPTIVPTKREKPKVKAIFAVAPTIKPVSRPKIAPRRAGH